MKRSILQTAIPPVRKYALKNVKYEKAVKVLKVACNKRIALFQTTNGTDMSHQCLPSQCAHVFLFLLGFFLSFCILICSLTLIAVLLTANQSALVRSR